MRRGSADGSIIVVHPGKDDPVRRNSMTPCLIRERFVANFSE